MVTHITKLHSRSEYKIDFLRDLFQYTLSTILKVTNHLYAMLHCQKAILDICPESGMLELELVRHRRVLDSELAQNGGHNNRKWVRWTGLQP